MSFSYILYACASGIFTAELEKASLLEEMLPMATEHCIQGPLTHEEVCRKIQTATGEYDEFLLLERKLRMF